MRNLIITVLLASAVLLASCGERSQSAEALARWEIVNRGGSARDRCRAAREVQDAYLAEHNEEQFQLWRSIANVWCMSADFAR